MEIAFTPENAELIVAVAKSENFKVLSNVIDESIRRAAEEREKSEAIAAERRAEEARRDRAAEIERQEREAAEEVAQRNRAETEAAATESAARKQAIRSVNGRLDVAA